MNEPEANIAGRVTIHITPEKPIEPHKLKDLVRKFADTCGRLNIKQLQQGVTVKQYNAVLKGTMEIELTKYDSCAEAEIAHGKMLAWKKSGPHLIGSCNVLGVELAQVTPPSPQQVPDKNVIVRSEVISGEEN